MFKGQNIFGIIAAGGFTMYILILCSVLSIAVIIERMVYYTRRSRLSKIDLMDNIRKECSRGQVLNAVGFCKNIDTPAARVVFGRP